MRTKNILLVSSDKDFTKILKISALTLTKLNCQVNIEETIDYKLAIERSTILNLDLIIVDLEETGIKPLKLMSEIRKDKNSKSKKIISVYENKIVLLFSKGSTINYSL